MRELKIVDATELANAYAAADYVVAIDGDTLPLRVGQPAIDLEAYWPASRYAFITAWNPRSRPRPAASNRAAHSRLLADLDRLGLRHLPHRGADPARTWQPEEGLFVLDAPLPTAITLATTYQQNAVVAVTIGEPARLVLTELLPVDAG